MKDYIILKKGFGYASLISDDDTPWKEIISNMPINLKVEDVKQVLVGNGDGIYKTIYKDGKDFD